MEHERIEYGLASGQNFYPLILLQENTVMSHCYPHYSES